VSDPVEGDQFWFSGINSGDTYIGEVVYFEPLDEKYPDEDWAQPRVMLRPLLRIGRNPVYPDGPPWVTDQTRGARWTQWCRLSDVVPVEK